MIREKCVGIAFECDVQVKDADESKMIGR